MGGEAERRAPDASEAAAFGERYRALKLDVARLCARMLGPGPAAEDAAGEVFLNARRAWDRYDAKRPFRPWLLAIAGNHCIDQLRRRGIEGQLFDPRDFSTDDLAAPGPSPLQTLVRAEERTRIQAAIDALPAKYRLPLVLRYFGELEYDAIAEVLEVTRNQVGTLLFRAKRRLRERLAEESARGREP